MTKSIDANNVLVWINVDNGVVHWNLDNWANDIERRLSALVLAPHDHSVLADAINALVERVTALEKVKAGDSGIIETRQINGIDYRVPNLPELFELLMLLQDGVDKHIANHQPIQSKVEDTLTVEEQKEIRDYIRYRCGAGIFDKNNMPGWLVDIEEKLAELSMLKAKQPVPATVDGGWNNGGYYYVWRSFKHNGEWIVDKIKMSCLDGIYWKPYYEGDSQPLPPNDIPGESKPTPPEEVK